MAYKVVGHTEPRIPRHLLGVYRAPEEVLRLNEDIQTLELIIELVNRLDTRTINEGNESGVTVRRLNFILAGMRNQARDRLKRDYLAGQPPIKPRQKPQTMLDVWHILKYSMEEKEKRMNAQRNALSDKTQ